MYITWLDYVLLPLYLGIIYFIANNLRNRFYPEGHPWRPYFIPGLTVKIAGALFIGLIYQYYYHSGDTFNYFSHARIINTSFEESPWKWLNLVLHQPEWYDADYMNYTSRLYWYRTLNNYVPGATAAFFGIFTFNTFLPTSILFAVFAYTGIWAMFRVFAKQYPALVKHIALVTLFIPSTFIWGSGIFKDTLCMFGLGWLLYATFSMLVERRFLPGAMAMGLLGFYLISIVKLYILVAFIPALVLWVLFSYSYKVQSGALRFLMILLVAGIGAGGIAFFASRFSVELGQYSVQNVVQTSTVIREYIYGISGGEEGSGYTLGAIENSLTGMLTKFPLAVNVSLFRPYLWEARKPIVMFNALEAFLFLFFTLKILLTLGPVRVWKAITSDPNIQFCLAFTFIFAFAVGISSGNFGALSRYRIPCLPTYGLALILIYYRYNDPEKPFLRVQ